MQTATILAIITGIMLVLSQLFGRVEIEGHIIALPLAFILALLAFHMRAELKNEQRD